MTEFQERVRLVKEMLAEAVAEVLERKRRLGQYAVIARDGKPYRLLPNDMPEPRSNFQKVE